MRFLFIVQGEGRGHLTQAISLAEILHRHDHEIVEVLVGKSRLRELPAFFGERIGAPLRVYEAPSFVFKKDKKHIDKVKTFIYNTTPARLRRFGKSIEMIHQRVKTMNPDVVVNFYEILPGFMHLRFKLDMPFVNIGHQYLLRHPDYPFGKDDSQNLMILKLHAFLSSIGAAKLLALSFYPMNTCSREKLVVTPPLLRQEVLERQPAEGDYILGYIVNQGYLAEVRKWHEAHPEVSLHFFWDKKDAPPELVIDPTLTLHQINDAKFLHYMEKCRGYITTAGFESVCEALFMNKRVMLIPAHIEQEINAADAASFGGGIVGDCFDLSLLLSYIRRERLFDHESFRKWVFSAEKLFIKELTSF